MCGWGETQLVNITKNLHAWTLIVLGLKSGAAHGLGNELMQTSAAAPFACSRPRRPQLPTPDRPWGHNFISASRPGMHAAQRSPSSKVTQSVATAPPTRDTHTPLLWPMP